MEMEYRVRAGETGSSVTYNNFLREIEERINSDTELIESIKKNNVLFSEKIKHIVEEAKPEYYGTAVVAAMQKTPRYSYIKNLEYDGKLYDAEIDALSRTFVLVWTGLKVDDEVEDED